ncbi:MAG: sulfur relay protein DsrC [Thiomargarita sp.]|nr:sulfur relay protein DsrC [Thiomargarita sp.]
MLNLSELLMEHHELKTFEELLELLKHAKKTERFFRMDVLPPFPDTPENWEDRLEATFY